MDYNKRAIKFFSLFAAIALLASACIGTASGSEDGEQSTVDLPEWSSNPWNDSYNHFLVRWDPNAGELVAADDSPKLFGSQSTPDDFEPIDGTHPLAGNGGPTTTSTTEVVTTTTSVEPVVQYEIAADGSLLEHELLGNSHIFSVTEVGEDIFAVATDLEESALLEVDGILGVWVDSALVLQSAHDDSDSEHLDDGHDHSDGIEMIEGEQGHSEPHRQDGKQKKSKKTKKAKKNRRGVYGDDSSDDDGDDDSSDQDTPSGDSTSTSTTASGGTATSTTAAGGGTGSGPEYDFIDGNDGSERDAQWYLDNTGQLIGGVAGLPDADIDATDAWLSATGAGVVVAIVDTGVQIDHPDLANQLWTNPDEICGNGVDDDNNGYVDDCNGANVLDDTGNVTDNHGHGTHIAGTVAAEVGNGIGIAGIAPHAEIMAVKIGNGSSTISAGIEGIRYAVNNGADIINLSWGTTEGTPIDAVPPLADAIEYARQNGVLVVIAAGNSSTNIDERPTLPASYGHDNIITVGASTNTDDLAYFSNYGPVSVDLFSPGMYINATKPGGTYGYMSGTSMAAPTVVGAAALVWSAHPNYTYAEVKQSILASADRKSVFNGKSVVPARTNAIGAIGNGAGAVEYTFSGFSQLVPGETQAVTVAILPTGEAEIPTGPLSLRATLIMQLGEELYGVAEHTITSGADSFVTNEFAEITFASDLSLAELENPVTLDLGLPEGTFGLLVEIISNGQAVADAGLISFTVAVPVVESSTTTTQGSVDSGQSTTTQASAGGESTTTQTTAGDQSSTTQAGGETGEQSTTTQAGATGPTILPGPDSTTSTTQGSAGGGGSTGDTTTTSPDVTNTTQTGAGGGGSTGDTTTSTTSPSTGGGGSTGDTTTTSPSTGGGSATTTTIAPAPDSPGTSISTITPSEGPVAGGIFVTIVGNGFGINSVVLFDGSPGSVSYQQGDSFLIVETPGHSAGAVTVTVTSPSGAEASRLDGFTFVAELSVPDPDLATTTTAAGGSGGGGDSTSTTAPSSGGGDSSSTTAPSTGGDDGVTATTVWPPYQIEAPNGLTLVPLHPDRKAGQLTPGMFGFGSCTEDPCNGRNV